MIEQLPFVLTLSDEHLTLLESKRPWEGSQWNDEDFKENIKPNIRTQLDNNQDSCAYCGLPFKGDRDKQIEHIAPKARYRYPGFTFTLQNLVLSCGYCNDLIVKGARATIQEPVVENYTGCEFLLVHPYFDNPDDHYDWVEDEGVGQVLIQIKNSSPKALFSINMFDLASTGMSQLRACAAFRVRKHLEKPITDVDEELIQEALNFRP